MAEQSARTPGRKSYVVVGTGSRSAMYIHALAGDFKESGELKAFCDINQARMDFHNRQIGKWFKHPAVATYKAQDFDRMILEQRPDV